MHINTRRSCVAHFAGKLVQMPIKFLLFDVRGVLWQVAIIEHRGAVVTATQWRSEGSPAPRAGWLGDDATVLSSMPVFQGSSLHAFGSAWAGWNFPEHKDEPVYVPALFSSSSSAWHQGGAGALTSLIGSLPFCLLHLCCRHAKQTDLVWELLDQTTVCSVWLAPKSSISNMAASIAVFVATQNIA